MAEDAKSRARETSSPSLQNEDPGGGLGSTSRGGEGRFRGGDG